MNEAEIKLLNKVITDKFYGTGNSESEDILLVSIAQKLGLPSAEDMAISHNFTYPKI